MIRMWRDMAKKYVPNSKVYFFTRIEGEKSAESNDIDKIFFKDYDCTVKREEFLNMN